MLDFTGQVVVVTGAGGNLGSAIAQTLARQGAMLALADMRQPKLERTLFCARPGRPGRLDDHDGCRTRTWSGAAGTGGGPGAPQ